jgi:hypothetical protein
MSLGSRQTGRLRQRWKEDSEMGDLQNTHFIYVAANYPKQGVCQLHCGLAILHLKVS